MDFALTVNIRVEHLEDMPHLSREQVLAQVITAIESADDSAVFATEDGENYPCYEVTVWDVEEA